MSKSELKRIAAQEGFTGPLHPELYRILLKRTTNAIDKAKYYPAEVAGDDGPARLAEKVLEPWKPK